MRNLKQECTPSENTTIEYLRNSSQYEEIDDEILRV